jgi:MarR family 2-MHQ and catechol resistance regulon transcriptional repressor
MPELTVGDDGFMRERATVPASVDGEYDSLTHEAHEMLIKAYTSLTATIRRRNPTTQSLGRYNVLRHLHYAPSNRLLMNEIGDALETSPTVVTRLVDSLVTDGLVRRVEHLDDKRKTWAELTDAGTRLYGSEHPAMAREVERAWGGVSDEEKRLLVHLLSRFRLSLLTAPVRDLA